MQQRLLPILVRRALFKAGDVPRKGLPQVMDDTHANDLVHVGFREFLLQEKGHQGHIQLCSATLSRLPLEV